MSEYAEEAERRQHVIRMMGLICGGKGRFLGCKQVREIVSRSRVIAPIKERYLDCWKGEREHSRKRRPAVSKQHIEHLIQEQAEAKAHLQFQISTHETIWRVLMDLKKHVIREDFALALLQHEAEHSQDAVRVESSR